MNTSVVFVGFLLFIAGIFYPIFQINLGVVNTTSISNINVSCSSSNVCTASASVTNVNGTSLPLYVYFVIKNYIGQAVSIQIVKANIPAGSTQTVTTNSFTLASGSYTMNVFVVDSNNYAVSKSYTYTFSTGSLILYVYTLQTQGFILTISPKANNIITNPNGVVDYFYAPGTQINVTVKVQNPSQTTLISCLLIGDAQSGDNVVVARSTSQCPQTRAQNDPLGLKQSVVFTIQQNVYLQIFVAYSQTQYYTTVSTVVIGSGSVNPNSAKLYQYASSGPQSQTFTFTPNSNSYLQKWILKSSDGQICASGTNSSYTLTFSTAYNCGGLLGVSIVAYFSQNPSVIVGSDPQITTSPSSGTYYPTYKSMFTVSITNIASGYCFAGWDVNGQPYGKTSSISLNMTQSYSVYAHATQCSSSQTSTTTSGTTTVSSSQSGSGLTLGTGGFSISGLSILGLIVIFVGIVMKRERS
jgi:hypothetical protein